MAFSHAAVMATSFAKRMVCNAQLFELSHEVRLSESQSQLGALVLAANRLPALTRMPTDGFAAGVEKIEVFAVTPEQYARLRPSTAGSPRAWAELVAHEVVHREQVHVLAGDEGAMGPVWFYEWLAVA